METADRERLVHLSDEAVTTVEHWGTHGPLLVAVHGLGASRRGWARVAEALAARYRVVSYDQRGHGDHSAPRPMTFEQTVADLADVVASLGEHVHALLGHSWGGAVAIAGGRRLDVDRVAVVDPMLHVAAGVWSRGAGAEFARMFELTPEEREAGIRASNAALPDVEVEAKLHAARRLAREAVEGLDRENGIEAGRWDLRELVRDYPKPLLLALADPKRSVVLDDQRELFRASGGPNVRIEVFAGASHSLQRDAFDRFMPVLEAFLASS
jgi:pimeloyl-ACP methyl ester carboxylesterase